MRWTQMERGVGHRRSTRRPDRGRRDAPQGQGMAPSRTASAAAGHLPAHSRVRHMLAALDLATAKMLYRIRSRKRWAQFLDLLKALRARY